MSLKFGSPLLGYNNNVRHKGRVFHIQTEDSGAKYGHIITHLFMDGGRILKSVKTSYAEHVESDRREEIVRNLMKQQHKAMAIALRDGKFDPMVEGNTGVSQGTLALAKDGVVGQSAPARAADATQEPVAKAALSPARVPASEVLAHATRMPSSAKRRAAPVVVPESASRVPVTRRSQEPDPESALESALEMDRVERAAAAAIATPPPARQPLSDLPPPPANLLREKTAKGAYRVTPSPEAPLATTRPAPARPTTSGPPTATGRAGAARPASSFGQAKPQGQSIFGEVTDKSLDEVILSYLAAELETDKK